MIDHPELWAGLSPRVRGSRGEHRAGAAYDGVYPRVCGGALVVLLFAVSPRGLSPRVRGSRMGTPTARRLSGSIPACAGEPVSTVINRRAIGVYQPVVKVPLHSSGAASRLTALLLGHIPPVFPLVALHWPAPASLRRGSLGDAGLSPRTAIPACAGEPRCP